MITCYTTSDGSTALYIVKGDEIYTTSLELPCGIDVVPDSLELVVVSERPVYYVHKLSDAIANRPHHEPKSL